MSNLTPEEYNFLRKECAWSEPALQDVEQALANSLVVFTKRIDGQITGTIRIVGDGRICFYIQDLMVAQAYRNQGIARELFTQAMDYIDQHAAHNAFIGLMAAKDVDGLYEKFGFISRPNDYMGPGMIKFHGRDNALTEE